MKVSIHIIAIYRSNLYELDTTIAIGVPTWKYDALNNKIRNIFSG